MSRRRPHPPKRRQIPPRNPQSPRHLRAEPGQDPGDLDLMRNVRNALLALFGLKTASTQRAEAFLAAAGVHRDWGSGGLGSADYLVSDRRRSLREYGERNGLLI